MIKKFHLILLLLLINVPLLSRDIDLDAVYIEKSSGLYREIIAVKEKLYTRISSLYIDSNVIFAQWCNGDEIVYIKEFSQLNIVYKYKRNSREKVEIVRFYGNVTYADLNRTGNIVYAKVLSLDDNGAAKSESVVININTKEITKKSSKYLFIDYTMHPSEDSVLNESKNGITKTSLISFESKLIIPSNKYNDIASGNDPVLAYISPDEKKTVIVTGNGGVYKTKILTDQGNQTLNGVTSCSDLRWIDNNRFVYMSGGAGDYSAKVYDVAAKKSKELISGTLNPDINYSDKPGIITALENQIIIVIPRDLNTRVETGIEGEESYFSPDGRKFTSIYLGKLYVSSLNMIEKYRLDIRRSAGELIKLYGKAANMKSIWISDYSREYINKKIKQYDKFLKMNP
ncbi:MAG: hypothetical protein FWF73_06835 [Spirochaetes bacterium]|nr:hypothetical protein [Spirochaetota bacterium]